MSILPLARRRQSVNLRRWRGKDPQKHATSQTSVKRPMLPKVLARRKKVEWILLIPLFFFAFRRLFNKLRSKYFHYLTEYHNTRALTEDDVLWRGSIQKNSIPELDTAVRIDLVVSHCDLPIHWIFQWAAPIEFQHITIYSKCGQPVLGAPENAEIVELENIGRCDHTYAHFMAKYHSKMLESSPPSEYVLFLKDNDNEHRSGSRHKQLKEMIPLAKKFGFACHEETNWVISEPPRLNPFPRCTCETSYYHDWEFLVEFQMEKYQRLGRDDNSNFISENGDSLGEYAEYMGIEPLSSIVPVCYGGNFMTQSDQILSRSPEFWSRIESSLSRGNNIAEGHFMERLWGTTLAKPVDDAIVDRIREQENPIVCTPDRWHRGVIVK